MYHLIVCDWQRHAITAQAVYLRHIFINRLLVTRLEGCSAVHIKMALQFYMTDHRD